MKYDFVNLNSRLEFELRYQGNILIQFVKEINKVGYNFLRVRIVFLFIKFL
jgi:hypothetical protein